MKRSRICCLGRWRLTKQAADCFKHSRFAEQRWKRFGRLVRDAHPDAHFTRLQIVKSNACGLHVDAENVGPSWAFAISIVHLNRIHCGSTCLCISLAFIGQERAWPSTSHALCVIVPVLLPRLHWAGTRSCICTACIVRHRACACASSSPSLGRNAIGLCLHCRCACWFQLSGGVAPLGLASPRALRQGLAAPEHRGSPRALPQGLPAPRHRDSPRAGGRRRRAGRGEGAGGRGGRGSRRCVSLTTPSMRSSPSARTTRIGKSRSSNSLTVKRGGDALRVPAHDRARIPDCAPLR